MTVMAEFVPIPIHIVRSSGSHDARAERGGRVIPITVLARPGPGATQSDPAYQQQTSPLSTVQPSKEPSIQPTPPSQPQLEPTPTRTASSSSKQSLQLTLPPTPTAQFQLPAPPSSECQTGSPSSPRPLLSPLQATPGKPPTGLRTPPSPRRGRQVGAGRAGEEIRGRPLPCSEEHSPGPPPPLPPKLRPRSSSLSAVADPGSGDGEDSDSSGDGRRISEGDSGRSCAQTRSSAHPRDGQDDGYEWVEFKSTGISINVLNFELFVVFLS